MDAANAYRGLLFLSGIITLFLGIYSYRQGKVLGSRYFSVLMVLAFVWAICHVLELSSADISTKVFWFNMQQAGTLFLPIMWLALALSYSKKEHFLNSRNLMLLSVLPVLAFFLVWTNNLHHLVRLDIYLENLNGFTVVRTVRNPFFLIFIVYSYLLLMVSGIVFLKAIFESTRLYRSQAIVLFVAFLLPFMVNQIIFFEVNPFHPYGSTVLAFVPSGLLITWGLFHFRLLNIWPIARDRVIEGMKDPILVFDQEDKLADFNPAAFELLKRRIEVKSRNMIGLHVSSVLKHWPEWQKAIVRKEENEIDVIMKEDSIHYYKAHIFNLMSKNRSIIGSVSTLHNVSDQKLKDTALIESEKKYRFLVDHSHDLIWILGANGVFSYASPSWVSILGYEPASIIDQSLHPFIYAEDLPRCEAYLQRLIEAKEALPGAQYRVKHADNSLRWHEATITPVFNSDGQFVHFVGLSRDITERKLAELALLKKTNELEAIIESTYDGILVVNHLRNVIYVNSRFKQMWRIDEEMKMVFDDRKLLDSVVEQLVMPQTFLKEVENLYQSYSEFRDHLSFKDGRFYEFFTRPLIGDGKLLGRLWSFRDITEQKKADEKLREMATTDGLTGLWNRRYFLDIVQQKLDLASHSNQIFSLLILDLDHFKKINDTLGHAAGDETLKQMASLMKNVLRDVDIPGRIGGEEFGILLPGTELKQAFLIAEKLRLAVENTAVYYDGQRINVKTSIGITAYHERITSLDNLFKEADDALYQAKRKGGNCTIPAEIKH